ncbi:flippase [Halobacteriales archaeon Cl-PHB]
MPDEYDEKDIEQLFRSFSHDSSITLIGRITSKGLKFLFQIVLTRGLSVSAYGAYAIAWTVFRILREVSTAGMRRLVFRFGAAALGDDEPGRLKGVLAISIGLVLTLGAIIGATMFVFAEMIATDMFNDPSASFIIRWLAPSLPFMAGLYITTAALRVVNQVDKYIITEQLLQPLLLVGISMVTFGLGYELSGVAIAVSGATGVAFLTALVFLVRSLPFEWGETKTVYARWRSYLSFSGVGFFLGLAVLLMNSLDRLMLGLLADTASVGLYNVAATVGALTSLVLGATNSIFPPVISRLYSQEKHSQLRAVFQAQSQFVFALSIPIYATFIVFGRELLSLFGPEYVIGYTLLLLVSFGHLINATTGSVGSLLSMTDYQNLEAVNYTIAILANVVLNIYLIPIYGTTGAAIATATVIGGLYIAKAVQAQLLLGIQPFTRLHLLILVATLMATGSYMGAGMLLSGFPYGKFFSGLMATVVYFTLVLVFEYIEGRIQIASMVYRQQ